MSAMKHIMMISTGTEQKPAMSILTRIEIVEIFKSVHLLLILNDK